MNHTKWIRSPVIEWTIKIGCSLCRCVCVCVMHDRQPNDTLTFSFLIVDRRTRMYGCTYFCYNIQSDPDSPITRSMSISSLSMCVCVGICVHCPCIFSLSLIRMVLIVHRKLYLPADMIVWAYKKKRERENSTWATSSLSSGSVSVCVSLADFSFRPSKPFNIVSSSSVVI